MSAENRTRGSGKSTGEGHSAGTAPSRARTRPGMSPAAAELSGLDKPACPQPHSPSPAVPRAGKGEVTGIRIPLGQEQQQEQGTKGWLLLGAAGGSGEEQSWAWQKPCPWCSCRAKLSGNSLEGSREGPVEAEGAAVLTVLSFPPSLSRSQAQQSVPGLCHCPPPPAPRDSVHLLWISAGSSSRLGL